MLLLIPNLLGIANQRPNKKALHLQRFLYLVSQSPYTVNLLLGQDLRARLAAAKHVGLAALGIPKNDPAQQN